MDENELRAWREVYANLHPDDRLEIYSLIARCKPRARWRLLRFPPALAFAHAAASFLGLGLLPVEAPPVMLAANYVLSLNFVLILWYYAFRRTSV